MNPDLAVEVCKDVLSQLDNCRFTRNYYFRKLRDVSRSKSIDPQWIKNNCEICFLGSMFLSFSKLDRLRADKFLLGDAIDGCSISGRLHYQLSNVFDAKELKLMECLFEGADYSDDLSLDEFRKIKSFRFNKLNIPAWAELTQSQLKEIVRYICENVIQNKGHFVLETLEE